MGGPFGYVGQQTNDGLADNPRKNCSMLKASFAFGIMNCIFFFFTFLFALWVGHHNRPEYDRHHRRDRTILEPATITSQPQEQPSPCDHLSSLFIVAGILHLCVCSEQGRGYDTCMERFKAEWNG